MKINWRTKLKELCAISRESEFWRNVLYSPKRLGAVYDDARLELSFAGMYHP